MTTNATPGALGSELGPWVPCSKQLPDSGTEVLVWRQPTLKMILRGHVAISACRYTKAGPIWDCDQGAWALPIPLCRQVTHWMPMPEGPNVGDERRR